MRYCVVPLFVVTFAATARAQSASADSLRVIVRDSAGLPVSGADVSVVRSLHEILAGGQTGTRGETMLSFPGSDAVIQVVVRKIGYQRSQQFIPMRGHGVVTASFMLLRTVAQLAAVTITADADVRRKSYFIDADELEKSQRPIDDALDVVQRLRPDMIWGRRGAPDLIDQHVLMTGARMSSSVTARLKKAHEYGYCPPVQSVFVNGNRIRLVPISLTAIAKLEGNGKLIDATIATVLASIKPEHIAEMSYTECTDVTDKSDAKSSNAIYVVLKYGVRFMPGIGSFVGQEPPGAMTQAPQPADTVGVIPAHRPH